MNSFARSDTLEYSGNCIYWIIYIDTNLLSFRVLFEFESWKLVFQPSSSIWSFLLPSYLPSRSSSILSASQGRGTKECHKMYLSYCPCYKPPIRNHISLLNSKLTYNYFMHYDVLWLQISMDYVLSMEILNTQTYLFYGVDWIILFHGLMSLHVFV